MTDTSNKEKTIIVTGANTGIGLEATKILCADGYDVIMACRSQEKATAAMDIIKGKQPDASVLFILIDMTEFASVRKFVEEFRALSKSLFALVNNAGIMKAMKGRNRVTTGDEHEVTMQVNYLAPFLLTQLLTPELKAGAKKFGESRVVNVASRLQDPEQAKNTVRKMNFTIEEVNLENFDFQREGSYCGINAYSNSKSALIMYTYTLAERLKDSGVLVNAMCPGFIPTTELGRDHGKMAMFAMRWVLPTVFWLTGRSASISTVQDGAQKIQALAVGSELKDASGKYYIDGKETESKGCTNNEELRRELFDFSIRAVGLDQE